MTYLGYMGFDQFYLNWFCMVPLLWAMEGVSPRRALFLGWVAGILAHGGGFYWLHYLLTQFGNLHISLAILGVLGIGIYHGLSWALWAWALQRLRARTTWPLALLAPLLWIVMEHFYPYLFPMYFGAGQYKIPQLLQIANLTGAVGTSVILVWGNIVAWEALSKRLTKRGAIAFAATLAAVLGYGFWSISSVDAAVEAAPKLKVGMIQTNLGAREKTQDPRQFLRRHVVMAQELDRRSDLDLIVWPESILTVRMRSDVKKLRNNFYGGKTPLILGIVTKETKDKEPVTLSHAMLVLPDGTIGGSFAKRRLVPFGEYIPLKDTLPFLDGWSPHQGNYQTGTSLEPIPFREYNLSASICYEGIHPGDIRALMVGDGDRTTLPHAMVNLTNDSWYGDTTEPMQHLVLASLRCIEHRRAMARATNTGISAFIDPAGRLVKRTNQWEEATLVGDLPMLEGRTLYSALGSWFAYLALAGTVIATFLSLRRRG